MKGQKFWTLLGCVAIATSCSTYAFAEDGKSAAKPAAFNELNAGVSRGIALDELFAAFKKPKPADLNNTHETAPKAAVTKPVPHTSKKPPVVSKVSKSKPEPIQTALFKPTGGNHTQLAVASGGGSSHTAIIKAWLDKPGALPKYKSGDRMVVKLEAAADCNVLVFDYDSHGTLTQLYPNEFEPQGTLKAGQTVEIGGSDSKYNLDVAGKGIERIFVYAYPTSEQPITVAMAPVAHTPFRSVEISPDQYSRLVKMSKTYFDRPGTDRSVKVTPKAGVQTVAMSTTETEKQPNKLELTFQIDK